MLIKVSNILLTLTFLVFLPTVMAFSAADSAFARSTSGSHLITSETLVVTGVRAKINRMEGNIANISVTLDYLVPESCPSVDKLILTDRTQDFSVYTFEVALIYPIGSAYACSQGSMKINTQSRSYDIDLSKLESMRVNNFQVQDSQHDFIEQIFTYEPAVVRDVSLRVLFDGERIKVQGDVLIGSNPCFAEGNLPSLRMFPRADGTLRIIPAVKRPLFISYQKAATFPFAYDGDESQRCTTEYQPLYKRHSLIVEGYSVDQILVMGQEDLDMHL